MIEIMDYIDEFISDKFICFELEKYAFIFDIRFILKEKFNSPAQN